MQFLFLLFPILEYTGFTFLFWGATLYIFHIRYLDAYLSNFWFFKYWIALLAREGKSYSWDPVSNWLWLRGIFSIHKHNLHSIGPATFALYVCQGMCLGFAIMGFTLISIDFWGLDPTWLNNLVDEIHRIFHPSHLDNGDLAPPLSNTPEEPDSGSPPVQETDPNSDAKARAEFWRGVQIGAWSVIVVVLGWDIWGK